MQWIANILGIDQLQSMKREQLAAQASADEHLAALAKECPDTVVSVLLLLRDKSRQQQAYALSTPLSGIKDALMVEHEQSMFLYKEILKMTGSNTYKCRALRTLQPRLITNVVKMDENHPQ